MKIASLLCVLGALAVTSGCAAEPLRAAQQPRYSAEPLRRGQIVPLVDHHQHIFGPDLVDPPTRLLPPVKLPDALERTLRERERVSGTREVSQLFTADATVLDIFFETDSWVTGESRVANVVEQHGKGLKFVPNAFQGDGTSAFISGIVHADDEGEYDKHFSIGLRRDPDGRWRIASEAITDKMDNPFRHPLDARALIMRLDDAGIQRATVLSTAYWLANPRRRGVENEQQRVRAANDWVIAQTALYPARLIPFCSVNPLSTYALEEVDRCTSIPRVRGIKIHFANGRVDLKNPDHLAKVRALFRRANDRRMALVVHLWPRGDEAPDYSAIFIGRVLAEAPDIPVQVAHLGSGAPNVFEATLGVFADAVARGDPRTRNLYFDVTEIVTEDAEQDTIDRITLRLRQIGLDRILFGSDTPLPRYRPPPLQAWATFRRRIPLSDAELDEIAKNVAPYLR